MRVTEEDNPLHIRDVQIAKGYRGRDAGTFLLNTAYRWARARGLAECQLPCSSTIRPHAYTCGLVISRPDRGSRNSARAGTWFRAFDQTSSIPALIHAVVTIPREELNSRGLSPNARRNIAGKALWL